MALIKCSECGKNVSDQAPTCPHCGHPVNALAVVTIQRTHKKWKAYKLIGLAVMLFGFLVAGGGNAGLGTLFFLLGLSAVIVGKMGAWWNNA